MVCSSPLNPDWKKIYSDYRNFQKDQILWFRFTEARFNSFMQSVKPDLADSARARFSF